MIAYHHFIQFVPEFKKYQHDSYNHVDTFTIRESTSYKPIDAIQYRLNFHNNQGREIILYSDQNFSTSNKGQLWVFEVKNIATFYWYSGKKQIEYIRDEYCKSELIKYWSLHTVLPIYFMIEEDYCFFHAGAIEINNKAILFTAKSYGGKSTLTDFFIKQGHTMISDDKVPYIIDDRTVYAIPSHPFHRPFRQVEELGYFVKNFSIKPKPIHAIYNLNKSNSDSKVSIIELKGMKKFKVLLDANFLNLSFLKQNIFSYISKVTDIVLVYQINIPWDIDRIDEVYLKIIEHNKLNM